MFIQQVNRAATALLAHMKKTGAAHALIEEAEPIHLVFKLKRLPGRASNKPVRM
jgi:hypothetical protein